MYAICNIIYGIPLNSNSNSNNQHDSIEEALEEEQDGFLSFYSGGSDVMPAAFGVLLGEFDEACHHIHVNKLPLQPTDEQKEEFDTLYDSLSPEMKKEVSAYGEASVFFLWSTS